MSVNTLGLKKCGGPNKCAFAIKGQSQELPPHVYECFRHPPTPSVGWVTVEATPVKGKPTPAPMVVALASKHIRPVVTDDTIGCGEWKVDLVIANSIQ